MPERSVIHSTFVIERSYPASPERVFEAFTDPAKKRRWFFEGEGHDVEHHELDFRTGGKEVARFRFKPGTPLNGIVCTNETTYLNIVPNHRVVIASTMSIAGNCISAHLATFELLPTGTGTDTGTDLILTHQGAFFEGSDGPERRELGWIKLLDRLTGELTQLSQSRGHAEKTA
jgi:uncharacterized protein YndB with AHSA1/START domain